MNKSQFAPTKKDPGEDCTIARPCSSRRPSCDLHPTHLARDLLHVGRGIVVWIGRLSPRQIHGSLVVLLRDGGPANTTTVSVSQGSAATPHSDRPKRHYSLLLRQGTDTSTWGVLVS